MDKIEARTIFARVADYRKLSHKFQSYLQKEPDAGDRLQTEFNTCVDRVYNDILTFEKENISEHKGRVKRLKGIFEKRYRRFFLYGEFIPWSLNKPFGYAGDFKIIDSIYKNCALTTAFDRLWDNYFLQLPISIAIRERKSYLKKKIYDFIKKRDSSDIRIMNLASGSAREIKEINEEFKGSLSHVMFDCYDFDKRSIDYSRDLLGNLSNVNYFLKNVVRAALRKDFKKDFEHRYDFIYSAGLFDYFDERLAIKLLSNLKKLLKDDGILIIANVRDRYSNPSVCWMEWVADWNLVYRTEDEFKKIFLDAGFLSKDINIELQDSRVIQYCCAHG